MVSYDFYLYLSEALKDNSINNETPRWKSSKVITSIHLGNLVREIFRYVQIKRKIFQIDIKFILNDISVFIFQTIITVNIEK